MTIVSVDAVHWDELQRDVLEALGHVLYVPAGTRAPRVEEEARNVHASARAQTGKASPPRAPERGTPPGRGASPDALMQALLRAANLDTTAAASLQPHVPALDVLAGSPESKRKLWPTLRARRRP